MRYSSDFDLASDTSGGLNTRSRHVSSDSDLSGQESNAFCAQQFCALLAAECLPSQVSESGDPVVET